ncbi:MAG: hypothetical protein P0Y63_22680 [Klebsiella huaxiensis]|uniref:hypothetical protein n=1 Tax=Klebsiella huaxiensis TaxID=2153354 RepID=UPI0026E92498|nr:hypothetical protein [Klebsiella huaxiensis]WEJ88070.1 MAG: hypothetical protein P0Y63_22680 [Klebsiella huaxiensis]
MHKFSLSLFTLSLSVALMPLAHAANTPAQQHLLEQVRRADAAGARREHARSATSAGAGASRRGQQS